MIINNLLDIKCQLLHNNIEIIDFKYNCLTGKKYSGKKELVGPLVARLTTLIPLSLSAKFSIVDDSQEFWVKELGVSESALDHRFEFDIDYINPEVRGESFVTFLISYQVIETKIPAHKETGINSFLISNSE